MINNIQVTSDDDTCLSSNIGSPTVCQSQISLFSSQKNNTSSAEKLAVPLNHDVAPTSSQNVSIGKSDFAVLVIFHSHESIVKLVEIP